ncbi:MAG: hypothetical protein E7774_13700 [Bradyrhizobium sp.]|nr:MAG: hypothetical protein E7774_13700 [Bradyrhizobium sp.]
MRSRIGGARRALAAVAIAVATLGLGAARAQDAPAQQEPAPDRSPLHSLAKSFGFATDVDPPPDFVRESRPATPQQEIPVFTPPPEPPGKIKSAKEVEDIDDDLESIARRHDALRAGYAPSARAVAAAKKVKLKPKPGVSDPTPPL